MSQRFLILGHWHSSYADNPARVIETSHQKLGKCSHGEKEEEKLWIKTLLCCNIDLTLSLGNVPNKKIKREKTTFLPVSQERPHIRLEKYQRKKLEGIPTQKKIKPTFHEKCVPAAVSYFRAPYWKSNPGPIVRGRRHDNILFSLIQTPAYNIEVKMEGSPQKSDIFCVKIFVFVAHSISLKKQNKIWIAHKSHLCLLLA